ncbi:MAG TPA: hypothetical protein VFS20_24135 [Longimicrobium sp.]|nr:hypothetical protein [Longimicrobium sp.]
MKHDRDDDLPAENAPDSSSASDLPIPERSPDQDDFDASFRAGIRGLGELLRRRRKKQ